MSCVILLKYPSYMRKFKGEDGTQGGQVIAKAKLTD